MTKEIDNSKVKQIDGVCDECGWNDKENSCWCPPNVREVDDYRYTCVRNLCAECRRNLNKAKELEV